MRPTLEGFRWLALLGALALAGCASAGSARVTEITITPREATVAPGGSVRFAAALKGEIEGAHPMFELFDERGDPCPADAGTRYGTLSRDGIYTAPAEPVIVEVHVLSSADRRLFARARVVVRDQRAGG